MNIIMQVTTKLKLLYMHSTACSRSLLLVKVYKSCEMFITNKVASKSKLVLMFAKRKMRK